MMLSFQLGGILIVPGRKLADHIGGETHRERGRGEAGERERERKRDEERERELVCVSFLRLRRKSSHFSNG